MEINVEKKEKNEELNPIILQLIELGYDDKYSRRVFYYFHPEDLEEALNYMAIVNNIIQHRFIKDNRNINNKLCYICGEDENIHLKELNLNNRNNNNQNNNSNNEINKSDNNSIYFSIENNNKNIENNNENNGSNNNSIYYSFDNNEKENSNKNNNNNLTNKYNNVNINEENKKSKLNDIKQSQENINNNINDIKVINDNKIQKQSDFINHFDVSSNNSASDRNLTKTNIENKNENEINVEISFKKEKQKIECPICNEEFISNNNNTVKNCGHSFCDGCWYDFLSIKIKENRLPSIKCLDYKCQSKLDDEFIINLLQSNKDLIYKYQKYKMELEIINNPNKKLCPFPNCDSYLELKDIKEQYTSCKNKHTYCFSCLKKPHGNLPCNNKLDKSIIEYASNNFVKKCPKCSIITEKSSGCNHITCSKCNFQWCWLCNEKYDTEHFYKGKCKGFQFYKPKNEYEIKLMMEGKINSDELSLSQRQEILDFNGMNNLENINNISNAKKILNIIIFLFFGTPQFIFKKYNLYWISIYILLTIAFFIPLFICNLISFLTFIPTSKLNYLIRDIDNGEDLYTRTGFLLTLNLYIGIFCPFYSGLKKKIKGLHKFYKFLKRIIFIYCFIVLVLVPFPNIIFYNLIFMVIALIKKRNFNSFLNELDDYFEKTFHFSLLDAEF